MNKLVQKSRVLMLEQTKKNDAPAWALTEIAVKKGRQLARRYKVREDLVLAALYLAHTVFSAKIKGRVQKQHEQLSARYVESYLKKWGVSAKDRGVILNAIEAHHDKVSCASKVAEVVKNAECFKFLTLKGALVLLHDMGRRGLAYDEAMDFVIYKMKQKLGYLSLPREIREGRENFRKVLKIITAK